MESYQPVPRAVYEALEELYLMREVANFTYRQDFMPKTVLNAQITDLHQEADGEWVTLEGGLRLRLDQLVAINGKPLQFWA